MTNDPSGEHVDEGPAGSSPVPGEGPRSADVTIPDPTAGMVLHRVLALSARTFLLNDLDDGPDGDGSSGAVDALTLAMDTRPLWARTAEGVPERGGRRTEQTERVHQSRVAMRRIRANLRTFRLLLDPGWGTSLRAELAWYGDELGRSRDLDLLADVVAERGPEVLDPGETARLLAVVDWRRQEVAAHLSGEEVVARRVRLTGQMMELWEGPAFKPKADRPATDVLRPMLRRAWHDLRGAGRKARKDPTDAHLHQLRIRLKDLRYGAETLALVDGTPARKTARAAERMQSKLGGLHDAVFSIGWLEELGAEQPDLADAAERLVAVQRDVAAEARKGWKRDLKEVERRWRRWQG